MNALFRLTVVTCFILLLASCSGWHLRGSENAGLSLSSRVFLSGQNSQTYSIVEQSLSRKDLLDSAFNSDLLLTIESERITRRSASVNSDSTTAEFELTIKINYEIRDKKNNILRPRTEIELVRSYNFNQDDISSGDKEDAILRKDLRRAAARQIIQQLTILDRIRHQAGE